MRGLWRRPLILYDTSSRARRWREGDEARVPAPPPSSALPLLHPISSSPPIALPPLPPPETPAPPPPLPSPLLPRSCAFFPTTRCEMASRRPLHHLPGSPRKQPTMPRLYGGQVAAAEAEAGAGDGGPPPCFRSVRVELTRHGTFIVVVVLVSCPFSLSHTYGGGVDRNPDASSGRSSSCLPCGGGELTTLQPRLRRSSTSATTLPHITSSGRAPRLPTATTVFEANTRSSRSWKPWRPSCCCLRQHYCGFFHGAVGDARRTALWPCNPEADKSRSPCR